MRRPGFIMMSVFLLFSCNSKKRFLDSSLEIMEKHAIYTDQVDWNKLRNDAYKQLESANNLRDVHEILRNALGRLGDNGHSFIIPAVLSHTIKTQERPIPEITSELINGEIGYIQVPGFVGTPNMAKLYALKLQDDIRKMDQNNLKGWIIDLRENTGGNMWPMLLGLAPLIGEGTYGFSVGNDQNYVPWKYKDGNIMRGNNTALAIENPYTPNSSDKKIAVLIGKKTASSGEATVVSFIGKENTKLFGVETAGLSTGNATFELKDGSILLLTTTIFMDRNKKPYGKSIKPDHTTFQARKNAIIWIND